MLATVTNGFAWCRHTPVCCLATYMYFMWNPSTADFAMHNTLIKVAILYGRVCWRIIVTLHYYHSSGDKHLLILLLRMVTWMYLKFFTNMEQTCHWEIEWVLLVSQLLVVTPFTDKVIVLLQCKIGTTVLKALMCWCLGGDCRGLVHSGCITIHVLDCLLTCMRVTVAINQCGRAAVLCTKAEQ